MATIKDVAEMAGVSVSTASRAMHDSPLISTKTKEKVRAAMKTLQYTPDFAAQNLARQTANILAVVLPPSEETVAENPLFLQIMQGVSETCRKRGYIVSVVCGGDTEELTEIIRMMIRQGRIRSFLFLYSRVQDEVQQFIMAQKNVRCAMIGTPYRKARDHFFYVDTDNIAAGDDATNCLLHQSYEQPVFVCTDLMEIVQDDRYLGYQRAMRLQGKEPLCLRLPSDYQKGLHDFRDFLSVYPNVDAFVAVDDILAVRLQRFLASYPDHGHYGIIGFNNSFFAQVAYPPLTSVEIYPHELGARAADLALAKETEKRNLIVPHRIIERETTKGPEQ